MIDSKENNYDWKPGLSLWIKRLVVAPLKYLVAASIFVFAFIFVFFIPASLSFSYQTQ